ncbi:MAG TPA: YidC/Oxa1 family insertase periplasmic-domain containing protein [Gemmatimonadaceae bacterium]|nr:YidC/Oxa1 family insertase periplasmic-domain containing protein [Gemmatimonadaceae bacterium]
MDRRFFFALLLTALVVVGTPFLFPSTRAKAPQTVAAGDSVRSPAGAQAPSGTPTVASPGAMAAAPAMRADTSVPAAVAPAPQVIDTTAVTAGGNVYHFVNVGASPVSVRVAGYADRRPGARDDEVQLVRADERLLRYRFVVGPGDTIALDTVPMRAEVVRGEGAGVREVRFTGNTARGGVAITYRFEPGDSTYLTTVAGRLDNAPAGSRLLVDLPRGLSSAEVDTLDDLRHLSFSYRIEDRDVESFAFAKLDTARAQIDTGAISWVAVRNKYFLAALLSVDEATPFRSVRMRGAKPVSKNVVLDAQATAAMPLDQGSFAFQLYAGPQKYERLNALGRDLVNVNPYGGWFAGMVQPFATIVMRVLLWLKQTTMLSYGWVLVIFGVLIRLAIWPLNQSAMRSSIRMQRLQPEMQAIQTKYARDPEKLREAMMRLYADHGMSPFSPVMGCLPMLIPMPVLFALYFVFQNTIEFRGVPFMWMPDLTLKDPFYITPIFMGLSMLLLSWIGMRGAPQTPQTKVMGYAMPAMMTVLFLNFPSGLNLYYAVQNVVALPQQWLLSRERAKAGIGAPVLGKAKA